MSDQKGGVLPTSTTRRRAAAGRYSSAFETSLPPTTEEEDSITIPKRGKLQRRVTSATIPMASTGEERGPPVNKMRSSSTASTTSSRFSFLNRFTSAASTTTLPPVDDEKDDLIQLDVEQTLHSLSSPTDGAAFSPAAFKNLQLIATGLLHKFQTAYTERTNEVRALRAAREGLEEEKEEMETRVEHLKMQLQVMVAEAEEKDEAMKSLVGELGRERKVRAEMEEKRRSAGSESISEDLEVEEDQDKRRSREYESDQDTTEAASVFSRSRSPTIMSSTDGTASSPPSPSPNTTPKATLQASPAITPTPRQRSPSLFSQASQPQMTTFQKLFKGKVAATTTTCVCNGQDSSVAWDTVSLLRDENRGLKERVGDLEDAVERALDVVNLVGM